MVIAILSERLGRESTGGTRHEYRPLSPVNVFRIINLVVLVYSPVLLSIVELAVIIVTRSVGVIRLVPLNHEKDNAPE